MFLRLVRLMPGQSFTLTATWNDRPNSDFFTGGLPGAGPVTGTPVVHSLSHPFGESANTVTITVKPA
jgi:hypothetical protein